MNLRNSFALALSLIVAVSLYACGGGGGGGGEAAPPTPAGDTTAPTVQAFYPDPAGGSIYSSEVQSNGIYVMFNEAAKDTTIDSGSFYVTDDTSGGVLVPGTVSYVVGEMKAKFVPDTPLTALFLYTVRATTALTDLAGNHLGSQYSWQFQVAGPTPPPPPP